MVTVLILGNTIFCINLGDSRAVLCRGGKAVDLSVDHKANLEREKIRVQQQLGYIFGGRVAGKLAITRAFGDFEMKLSKDVTGNIFFQDFLSVEPEIRQTEIDFEQDEFIVVASDGVFDKLTSQQIVDMAKEELESMPDGKRDFRQAIH